MTAGRPARTRPRVYVAHPVVTYGTVRERECLALLRDLLPQVDLYNPAGRFGTSAAWLRAWPRVLASLSGLVIFGTRENVVGSGCLREMTDASRAGVPVAMIHCCRACTCAGWAPPRRLPTPERAAVLVPGELVDLRVHLGLPPAHGAP